MADRDELRGLAQRVMALAGPDREVDARIWCALRGVKYRGHFQAYGKPEITQVEYSELPKRVRQVTDGRNIPHASAFTASFDAAMTLVESRLASTILHRAWSALAKECSLHIRFYDEAAYGPYVQRLARHVTAAALLALAEQVPA